MLPLCTVPATWGTVPLGVGAWMMRPGCAWLVTTSGTVEVVPVMGCVVLVTFLGVEESSAVLVAVDEVAPGAAEMVAVAGPGRG